MQPVAIVPPIPMLLFCPGCGEQHVDAPNPALGWDNPPHRTHQCNHCGYLWRPCDYATTGVERLTTKGQGDMPPRPSMVHVVNKANRRRDMVWLRTLLVALPRRTVDMVLAMYERYCPDVQAANEQHRVQWHNQLFDAVRQVGEDLMKEPVYTQPASRKDIVE